MPSVAMSCATGCLRGELLTTGRRRGICMVGVKGRPVRPRPDGRKPYLSLTTRLRRSPAQGQAASGDGPAGETRPAAAPDPEAEPDLADATGSGRDSGGTPPPGPAAGIRSS